MIVSEGLVEFCINVTDEEEPQQQQSALGTSTTAAAATASLNRPPAQPKSSSSVNTAEERAGGSFARDRGLSGTSVFSTSNNSSLGYSSGHSSAMGLTHGNGNILPGIGLTVPRLEELLRRSGEDAARPHRDSATSNRSMFSERRSRSSNSMASVSSVNTLPQDWTSPASGSPNHPNSPVSNAPSQGHVPPMGLPKASLGLVSAMPSASNPNGFSTAQQFTGPRALTRAEKLLMLTKRKCMAFAASRWLRTTFQIGMQPESDHLQSPDQRECSLEKFLLRLLACPGIVTPMAFVVMMFYLTQRRTPPSSPQSKTRRGVSQKSSPDGRNTHHKSLHRQQQQIAVEERAEDDLPCITIPEDPSPPSSPDHGSSSSGRRFSSGSGPLVPAPVAGGNGTGSGSGDVSLAALNQYHGPPVIPLTPSNTHMTALAALLIATKAVEDIRSDVLAAQLADAGLCPTQDLAAKEISLLHQLLSADVPLIPTTSQLQLVVDSMLSFSAHCAHDITAGNVCWLDVLPQELISRSLQDSGLVQRSSSDRHVDLASMSPGPLGSQHLSPTMMSLNSSVSSAPAWL